MQWDRCTPTVQTACARERPTWTRGAQLTRSRGVTWSSRWLPATARTRDHLLDCREQLLTAERLRKDLGHTETARCLNGRLQSPPEQCRDQKDRCAVLLNERTNQ